MAARVEPIRWTIAKRPQVLEELASSPDVADLIVPDGKEANEQIRLAVECGDAEAVDEAIVDTIRAEMKKWWPAFPERRLLTELFRRAARQRAGSGLKDSRRPTTHREGLCVAKALLAQVPDTSRLDSRRESLQVSATLASDWVRTPAGARSHEELLDFISLSQSSRAYFDALWLIYDHLDEQGEDIPITLSWWRNEIDSGLRVRPALNPIASHRPVNSANLERDVQIHFTIEILRRVAVPPRDRRASGCRMVAEALGLSEDTVERIWKELSSTEKFEGFVLKHLDAISERGGLVYATED